jgi:YidC/Oxa1 family membrane protein insertase
VSLASLIPLISMPQIPVWQQFVDLMVGALNLLVKLTGNPGIAIILFTLIIKFALTPLTIKTIKSQRAMQDLQPKIKALQKRYGNDRQKVSAETMRLYQTHSVNPMASCFPMLVQLPIFWGLYAAIRALFHGGDANFLWLHSLAQPDHTHVLPFVAAFFQLIQTRMSMPTGKNKPSDPQQKMMTQMMQFMPLTVIIFGWSFPAGLVLYWVTQSIFSAVQQYFITGWGALRDWLPFLPEVVRYTPPDPDEIDDSKVIVTNSDESPAPVKSGGLWGIINRQMAKVEEAQRAATHTRQSTDGEKPAAGKTPGETADGDRPRIVVQNTRVNRKAAVVDDFDEDEEPGAKPARPAANGAGSRVAVTKTAASAGAASPNLPRKDRGRR